MTEHVRDSSGPAGQAGPIVASTPEHVERDRGDRQTASTATGLLAELNRVGVLDAADIHVTRTIAAGTPGGLPEPVMFAAAVLVRVVRAGSVCLDLARLDEILDIGADPGVAHPDSAEVITAVRAHIGSVAGQSDADTARLRPLRLVDTPAGELLYFDRYFRQELSVRTVLTARSAGRPLVDPEVLRAALDEQFPRTGAVGEPDRQRLAAAVAATTWTTVLAGGPGTGKTFTVARLVAVLDRLGPHRQRVALCAPTGRAAANLAAAVARESEANDRPVAASTIHRLLGTVPGASNRFRHNAANPLPHDVVIVDEASMMSLTLMCRLLEALRPSARLILVGDPDQLASVDAGAVLSDMTDREPDPHAHNEILEAVSAEDLAAPGSAVEPAIGPVEHARVVGGVVMLRRGRRFGGVIAELADAIRRGDTSRVAAIVTGGHSEVVLCDPDGAGPDGARVGAEDPGALADFDADVVAWASAMIASARVGDAPAALRALNGHRVLCAHRDGPSGASWWSRRIQQLLVDSGFVADTRVPYAGQPLLLTANDIRSATFNGDTGVTIDSGDHRLRVAIERGQDIRLIHPARLPEAQPVYAMTIHRSQGSQYDGVSVVIPTLDSTILTRELLYTAVTRARHSVRLIGSMDALLAGVDRKVLRASGLRTPQDQWRELGAASLP
ncbi:exodeoxyribonuclease V subunit alpha [Gordonia jinhuaensis]|uniref:RecBCD enzyme subunit RecD n=1 Tax=Gordonia jinhuaensis TaxID=1517702 RepID=A0A916T8A9_9ACTN|nr:exodeoxyribonuclease V subunit alpha [Gordonia jinhuaensis]GGB33006.1 RecBCD enzyme subunit RecD [Gordonia jinhuaensis]